MDAEASSPQLRRGRRGGGVGDAEASSPQLRRGSREEEVRCTALPNTPWDGGLEASRENPTLLHGSLFPGGWDGGGHRAYCFTCRSWGNIEPMV